MTSMRTLPPVMIGHAADTAFLRTCSNQIAAPQHMSPDLQFAGDILARNETELSPQPAQTWMTRDKPVIGIHNLNDRFVRFLGVCDH